MTRTLPFLAALSLTGNLAHACSCMGNNSFCETLGSPFYWTDPDASVAVVVPLEAYHYGMYARVVQVVQGAELPDTIMVWGDNGGLCRIGMGFVPGDTVVFGLNRCDLMGNVIYNPDFPSDLEEEDDYMVSVCGVHAMDYVDGRVVGWITAPETQSLSMAEFAGVVAQCSLPQGMWEGTDEGLLQVADNGGRRPVLSLRTPARAQVQVLDGAGRCVVDRTWNGASLPLNDLPPATYLVQVRIDDRLIGRKVVVGSGR